MRLGLRLILSLVVGITLVTYFISRSQVRSEKEGLRSDLERRAEVFAESLQEIVEPAFAHDSRTELRRIVNRFENRQRLFGVAVYDSDGNILAESATLETRVTPPAVPFDHIRQDQGFGRFLHLDGKAVHVYYLPLHKNG